MTRVVLHFDDGTKIDFNDEADALFHLRAQGLAGVASLNEEADDIEKQGSRVKTRLQLEKALKDYAPEEEE